MLFFGDLDAEKGWTNQLHMGALREVITRRSTELGRDSGFDCVGDFPQAKALSSFLNLLEQENALPKMIVYNVNPAANYVLATVAGCFQDGVTAGELQFGSACGILAQKKPIEKQLNTLSHT